MANIRLNWTLPAVSARQRPIAGTRIEFRVDTSLPWTEQDTVGADLPQEMLLENVAPGPYFFRATVIDVDGQEGLPPVETTAAVPFDPPGSVSNFTATIE